MYPVGDAAKYAGKKNRKQDLIKPDECPRLCTLLRSVNSASQKSRREINF